MIQLVKHSLTCSTPHTGAHLSCIFLDFITFSTAFTTTILGVT